MFLKKSVFVIMILALFLVTACQAKNDSELTTVTINDSSQVNYAPIYFAQSEGILKNSAFSLKLLPLHV